MSKSKRFWHSTDNGFWFFPVKQGKNELKGPAEIYGQHNNTGLIARWTGN